jgi:hypothetical protein
MISTEDNVRLTAVFAHARAGRLGCRACARVLLPGWRSIEINGMYDDTYQYIDNVLALASEFR